MIPRRERKRTKKRLARAAGSRRIPVDVKRPQELVHRNYKRMTIRGILAIEIRKHAEQPTHRGENPWARHKWIWNRFYELMKGKIFAEQFLKNKEAYESFEVILRDRMALKMAAEKTTHARWINIEEALHGLSIARHYAIERTRLLRRKKSLSQMDQDSIEKCLEDVIIYQKRTRNLERLRGIGFHELPVGAPHDTVRVRSRGKTIHLTIEGWYERKRLLPSIERPHIQNGWFNSGLDHQIEGELTRILGHKRAEAIWEEEQDVVNNIVFGNHPPKRGKRNP